MFEKQAQNVGPGGAALQASGGVLIINNGITATEARQIAIDVMNANLLQYRALAMDTAKTRGIEVTDKFLEKLEKENPAGIQQAETPDFQDALFTVQKEYAKAGDPDLGDLLVDLLVDRTKQEARSLLQLVLNESLRTAPKLTNSQIAALSLVFLLRYVQSNAGTRQELAAYFKSLVLPIVGAAEVTDSTFSHLQFTGCGQVNNFMAGNLEGILSSTYTGLFTNGFAQEKLNLGPQLPPEAMKLIIPCVGNPGMHQISTLNAEILKRKTDALQLAEPYVSKLKHLLETGVIQGEDLKKIVVKHAPFMQKVFDVWNSTELGKFTLTSVGIAIGHANVKRLVGKEFAPLSIWIK